MNQEGSERLGKGVGKRREGRGHWQMMRAATQSRGRTADWSRMALPMRLSR